MIEHLITWVTQLAWLSLFIVIPGFILYVANEAWYWTVGRYSQRIELATGIVGTPVHEISHAIMVKLFGMTVVEMALYKPDPQSKSLGYVSYSYRSGSLRHGIGRFFVGIAPLIGGGLAVYALLLSSGLPVLNDYVQFIDGGVFSAFSAWIDHLLHAVNRPTDVLVILLCIMISTHATPSKADMAGSASGLISVALVYIAYRFLTSLFPVISSQYIYPYVNLDAGALSLAALVIQMATFGALASIFLSMTALGLAKIRSVVARKNVFGR
ncbi:hypothetical protein [Marinobacter sp. F3R08]|uniref:hypothetical protein n=1 Tax=Marinobacter sp. F3R08 TaxID=2841559 RepID=UPI001C09F67E|nr:hypothetical protein [Marinobacter sp. F3R08]MBU2952211.1 hypothetical protein [Marinobacter sp. F3R08]